MSMSEDATRSEETECPRCGEVAEVTEVVLSAKGEEPIPEREERSHVVSCTVCDFEIETESNLAQEERREQIREEIDQYL